MKKTTLFLLVILLFQGVIFASTDRFVSVGYQMGKYKEKSSYDGATMKTKMTSHGIALSRYSFKEGIDSGTFLQASFLFPSTGSISDGITTEEVSFSMYDYIHNASLIAGPGYRYTINNNLSLHYGFGVKFMSLYGSIDTFVATFSTSSFTLGVGADVGLVFDISNQSMFQFGSIIGYDFLSHTTITLNGESDSGFANNYSLMTFAPYIGFTRKF